MRNDSTTDSREASSWRQRGSSHTHASSAPHYRVARGRSTTCVRIMRWGVIQCSRGRKGNGGVCVERIPARSGRTGLPSWDLVAGDVDLEQSGRAARQRCLPFIGAVSTRFADHAPHRRCPRRPRGCRRLPHVGEGGSRAQARDPRLHGRNAHEQCGRPAGVSPAPVLGLCSASVHAARQVREGQHGMWAAARGARGPRNGPRIRASTCLFSGFGRKVPANCRPVTAPP